MLACASARAPGPKALGATDDIVLENDARARRARRRPSTRRAWRRRAARSSICRPSSRRSPGDQINGIYQARGPPAARRRPLRALGRARPARRRDAAGRFVAVVFRGHLEGQSAGHGRHPLRAACLRAGRARPHRLYNGARDPNTLYAHRRLLLGRQRTLLPFRSGAGLGFRAPELDLCTSPAPGASGRSWRRARRRPPESRTRPSRATAPSARDSTTRRCRRRACRSRPRCPATASLRALHPRDAGPGPRARRRRGAARAHAGPRRRAAGDGHGPRRHAAGPVDGRDGRAASLLFYEPAPRPRPRRRGAARAVERGGARRRRPLHRRAAARPRLPRAAVRVRPARRRRRPRSRSRRPTSTRATSRSTRVGAPGRPRSRRRPGRRRPTLRRAGAGPRDARPRRARSRPASTGSSRAATPMLGPPHGGSPACNRALTPNGNFDLLVPPGHYYVYATRGPFATLDRAEITLGAGRRGGARAAGRAVAGAAAGRRRCPATSTFTAAPATTRRSPTRTGS